MHLVGIDGAKRGHWVLATINTERPDSPVFALTLDLTEVFRRAISRNVLVVIDVPIQIGLGFERGVLRN